MQFFYGIEGNYTDITDSIICNSTINEYIVIPVTDVMRSAIHGDPVPGKLKHIKIHNTDNNSKDIIISAPESCIINTNTGETAINDPRFFWDRIGKLVELKEMQLELLHRVMPFTYGSLKEEYPEQLMVMLFLDSDAKVLEIGGNIGRNSCIIGTILDNDKNLVTLECSIESAEKLKYNRDLNSLEFYVEDAALSKVPLIQKEWETKVLVSDLIEVGWTPVKTITFEELEKKYNITFDTFVLDCEGAFYQILKDDPQILKNIKTIIIENDFHELDKKQYVDNVLSLYGFVSVYQLPGPWGPAWDRFYEVFKKQ